MSGNEKAAWARLNALVMLVCVAGCGPQAAPKPHADQRQAEGKKILGVTPPFSLVRCDDMYHAGVPGILVGSENDTLLFVLPAQSLGPKLPRNPSAAEIRAFGDSLRLGFLVPVRIGSLDGRKGDGRPLAIGSPEESLLIWAIKSAKRPPPSPPRHVHDHGASAWADWLTSYLEKRRARLAADTLTKG